MCDLCEDEEDICDTLIRVVVDGQRILNVNVTGVIDDASLQMCINASQDVYKLINNKINTI